MTLRGSLFGGALLVAAPVWAFVVRPAQQESAARAAILCRGPSGGGQETSGPPRLSALEARRLESDLASFRAAMAPLPIPRGIERKEPNVFTGRIPWAEVQDFLAFACGQRQVVESVEVRALAEDAERADCRLVLAGGEHPVTGRSSGQADVVALVGALLLAGAAAIPDLLLRSGKAWEQVRRPEPAAAPAPPAGGSGESPRGAMAGAETALARIGEAAFRPDPALRLSLPEAAGSPTTGPTVLLPRVTDLDGRVVDGRLVLRWSLAPAARGTNLRIEGLRGAESQESREFEVAPEGRSLEVAIPGTVGTLVVRALPAGTPGAVPEARVSIPFRIPVEILGADRASVENRSAFLRLRRPFDGRTVEAEFSVHETEVVGDLSSAGPGGPIIDFRTDLVLEEVRAEAGAGPPEEVPQFASDGRVQRDPDGRPLVWQRPAAAGGGHEVVLRGPNEQRRVLKSR